MNSPQGTPISFEINVKTEQGQQTTYVTDLSGYTMEALLRNRLKQVVKTWSTGQGSITNGSYTEGGITKGYLAFFLEGEETAKMRIGEYTLEIAKLLNSNGEPVQPQSGRAIGIEEDAIIIDYAAIREGVE